MLTRRRWRSSSVLGRSSSSVLRSQRSSNVVRRRRSCIVVRRRLHLSVCCGRLRGATWLLLLLHPHGKRIGFLSSKWVISKYIFNLFSFFLILYMMLIFLCLLSFSSWLDTNWDGRGHYRQVNQILGNLIRLHYPELVMKGGHSEPATTWHDYARAPDARVGNAEGVVRHAFWVSLYMFINFVISCNTYFCTNNQLFDTVEKISCE
jgi:hypothetical protein